jgi:hypothetical protein
MIKSIGIRSTPSEIFYTISENVNRTINLIAIDSLIVPIALEMPEKLKFVRNTFIDILEEYQVTNACIRITESNAQSQSIERINLEAIIQELIASSTIEKYYIGQISNISKKLNIPRENFKRLISNELDFEQIENWRSFSNYQKESILSSISALNL